MEHCLLLFLIKNLIFTCLKKKKLNEPNKQKIITKYYNFFNIN